MDWDEEVDATGLLCPLPVLRARRRLAAMRPGAVLRLLTDDPAAAVDIPHFCAESGHLVVSETVCAVAVTAGAGSDAGRPTRSWLLRRG